MSWPWALVVENDKRVGMRVIRRMRVSGVDRSAQHVARESEI